ncbi:hypothetical protein [Nostoc sp. C117]|uniref:hypothetical protein n=1 Tax=Nostoc sp. C117 TaxID=3349875 RepID=UPI00370DC2EE
MSYVSLLKSIPEIISQPIGIAAIASLGIHGAIAMFVPLMPMDSSKPKETASSKTVGLLELSQADQSRLPQTTPQIGLQQLPPVAPLSPPNFSAQTLLPPLAPPPSSQLVLPPLPPSSNNYRVSSLPTRQSLRMIPSDNLRFDASKFDSSKFNNTAKFTRPVTPLNESDGKYEAPKLPAQPGLPNLQPQPISNDLLQNSQSQALAETSPITTPQLNPTSAMTQVGNNDGSKIAQNSLINSLKQAPRNGNTLIGTRGSTPQAADLFGKGTQQISQLDSYAVLRKEVQQQYPSAEQKPVIRETLATDKPNLEGSVLGVLVVDADGKVLDIKFQDKLVSPELRTKAREYFSKQSLKGNKNISSYPFNLVFQNNTSNTTGTNSQGQKLTPLFAPGVNGSQRTPSAVPTSKPLSETPIRTNSPASLPTGTLKPLVLPGFNKNQPSSSPTSTLRPLSVPRVNSNQLRPFPTATSKPLSEVQIKNNLPTPSSAASTSQPLAPGVNKNQQTPAAETEQELLEQLRQLKTKREKSNLEK